MNVKHLSIVVLAVLLMVSTHAAHAADKQANGHGGKQPRHVTHALSTITVKVVAQADFARKLATRPGTEVPDTPWTITAADADSCTAWVSERASEGAELAAFRACRRVIDGKVDAAHAAAEKDGAR